MDCVEVIEMVNLDLLIILAGVVYGYVRPGQDEDPEKRLQMGACDRCCFRHNRLYFKAELGGSWSRRCWRVCNPHCGSGDNYRVHNRNLPRRPSGRSAEKVTQFFDFEKIILCI